MSVPRKIESATEQIEIGTLYPLHDEDEGGCPEVWDRGGKDLKFYCTRESGHDGPCVAHTDHDEAIAIWNEP